MKTRRERALEDLMVRFGMTKTQAITELKEMEEMDEFSLED